MNAHSVHDRIPEPHRSTWALALDRARTIVAAGTAVAGDLARELRKLNALGFEIEKSANESRRTRAKIVREMLKMRYRDKSACC